MKLVRAFSLYSLWVVVFCTTGSGANVDEIRIAIWILSATNIATLLTLITVFIRISALEKAHGWITPKEMRKLRKDVK